MPKHEKEFSRAFRELVRVLEEAVQAGADSVELEFEDRELIVYFNFGNAGIGGVHIPKELQRSVIDEIWNQAQKSRGKFPVSLLGKEYLVAVKTRQSFDEWVYLLVLEESRAVGKKMAGRGKGSDSRRGRRKKMEV